jgi:hypothetical protein
MSDLITRECIAQHFGSYPNKYTRGGLVSDGGYVVGDNFIKLYAKKERTYQRSREIDIAMRFKSPGVVKCYDFYDKEEIACMSDRLDYILRMEFVKKSYEKKDLRSVLTGIMHHISANIILMENDYNHQDIKLGENEIYTDDGFKLIDLNNVWYIDYMITREHTNYMHNIWYALAPLSKIKVNPMITGEHASALSQVRKYQTQLPIYFDKYSESKYSHGENLLIDDLLLRTFSNIEGIMMDIYDIPNHPIFKLHNVEFIRSTEEKIYILPINDNMDYITPLLELISTYFFFGTKIQSVFEIIDLYYRCLPFVSDEKKLREVIINCAYVIKVLDGTSDWLEVPIKSPFENLQTETKYIHKIIKWVKGGLRPRNFYHMCKSVDDYIWAWKLIFLPYETYMKIKSENFYKIVPPTYDSNCLNLYFYDFLMTMLNIDPTQILEDNDGRSTNYTALMPIFAELIMKETDFIQRMVISSDYMNNVPYSFNRLSLKEIHEYLTLNSITYNTLDNYDKVDNLPGAVNINTNFFLGDICKRVYIYNYHNNIKVTTQAIKDLIVQHSWKYWNKNIKMYTNNDIDVLTVEELTKLADDMGIQESKNLRESLRRILRMSCLLSSRT